MIGELLLIQVPSPAPGIVPSGAAGAGEAAPGTEAFADIMAAAVDGEGQSADESTGPAPSGAVGPTDRLALGWARGRLAEAVDGAILRRRSSGPGDTDPDRTDPAEPDWSDDEFEAPDASLLAGAVVVPSPTALPVAHPATLVRGDRMGTPEAPPAADGPAAQVVVHNTGTATVDSPLSDGGDPVGERRPEWSGPEESPAEEPSQRPGDAPSGPVHVEGPGGRATSRTTAPSEGRRRAEPIVEADVDLVVGKHRQAAAAAIGAALAQKETPTAASLFVPEAAVEGADSKRATEVAPAQVSAPLVLPPGVMAAARRAWRRAEGPGPGASHQSLLPEAAASAAAREDMAASGRVQTDGPTGPVASQTAVPLPDDQSGEAPMGAAPAGVAGGFQAGVDAGDPSSHQDAGPRQGQARRAEGGQAAAGLAVAVPAAFEVALGSPVTLAGPPVPTTTPESLPPSTGAQVSAQLIQSLRMQFRNGIGDAVLHLRPEHLGEVTVALRVEHGVVSASIQAEDPAVRHWLASQESALRDGLSQHGLDLGRLVVEPDEPRDHLVAVAAGCRSACVDRPTARSGGEPGPGPPGRRRGGGPDHVD